MVQITISIPERVYEALETARKQNTAPKQHPDNPEAVIVAPVFSSVEEWLQMLIDRQLAPYAAQVPSDEQKALAEEIAAKTKQLEEMSRPTISVSRV